MAKSNVGPITTNSHKRSYAAEGGDIPRGYAVMAGTGNDQVKIATAAARCVGVMEELTSQNKTGAVVAHGETIAIAGAAIVRLDRVKADAAGKLVPGNAADVETVGYALNDAAADGDEFVIYVQPIHKRS
jgi:broad specificity phosphatase PhoE